MKSLNKIIAVILCCLLVFGTAVACDSESDTAENEFGTVHDYTSTPTDIDLFKSGTSEYVIVYPEEQNDYHGYAVEELRYFVEEATGYSLPAVSDKDVTYSSSAKYLSIGETSLFEAAGLTLDKSKLGEAGYIIETVGQSVFMAGGQFGNLYAVYEFLRQEFGYAVYAIDEIVIEKNVTDKKLLDFSVTDIPDIPYRLNNWGEERYNLDFSRRMRMNYDREVWMPVGGLLWHNFLEVVPKDVYLNKDAHPESYHPEWYNSTGTQLCFSRDVDGLKAVVEEELKRAITENPNVSNLTFTIEDNGDWCECESCAVSTEKYGAESAVYIQFMNVIARDIKDWLKTTDTPDREVTIVMFAYASTLTAPVKLDENGGYEPVDDSVVLDDNVGLYYAPEPADYYRDFYSDNNTTYDTLMKQWRTLTDKVYLWTYTTFFRNYFLPFNCFTSMQKNYQWMYENKVQYIFNQGQYNQNNVSPDFGRLKMYLNSQLSWNFNQDVDALIDDWFDNYFKEAAEPMKKFFDLYQTYFAYLADTTTLYFGTGTTYSTEFLQRRYWPISTIENFLEIIDEAYASIGSLQTSDPAMYQLLSDRICLESLSMRYLKYELYSHTMSTVEADAWFRELGYDATRLGVGMFSEEVSTSTYFA